MSIEALFMIICQRLRSSLAVAVVLILLIGNCDSIFNPYTIPFAASRCRQQKDQSRKTTQMRKPPSPAESNYSQGSKRMPSLSSTMTQGTLTDPVPSGSPEWSVSLGVTENARQPISKKDAFLSASAEQSIYYMDSGNLVNATKATKKQLIFDNIPVDLFKHSRSLLSQKSSSNRVKTFSLALRGNKTASLSSDSRNCDPRVLDYAPSEFSSKASERVLANNPINADIESADLIAYRCNTPSSEDFSWNMSDSFSSGRSRCSSFDSIGSRSWSSLDVSELDPSHMECGDLQSDLPISRHTKLHKRIYSKPSVAGAKTIAFHQTLADQLSVPPNVVALPTSSRKLFRVIRAKKRLSNFFPTPNPSLRSQMTNSNGALTYHLLPSRIDLFSSYIVPDLSSALLELEKERCSILDELPTSQPSSGKI